jgi:hypothetical protein
MTTPAFPCLVVEGCTDNHLRDTPDPRPTSVRLRDAEDEATRLRGFVELVAGLDTGEDLFAANVVTRHDLAAAAREVLR